MKKMISMLLAAVMLLSFAACGDNDSAAGFAAENAEDLLQQVWGSYTEDQQFMIMGGDADNNVMGEPAAMNHENAESMDSLVGLPAANASMVDSAASMIHAMNANTFTAAVFHLTDSADTDAFVSALQENIQNRQWMCGFPEQLLIVSDGNGYVVSAFGAADLMEVFKTNLLAIGGEVVVEESLM